MKFKARFVFFYVANKWIIRTGVSIIFEMEFKVRFVFYNIENGTVLFLNLKNTRIFGMKYMFTKWIVRTV